MTIWDEPSKIKLSDEDDADSYYNSMNGTFYVTFGPGLSQTIRQKIADNVKIVIEF